MAGTNTLTDGDAAYMDYDSGYAIFGAKANGANNRGVIIRALVAGTAADTITIAPGTSNVAVGGLLTVYGFGVHAFSAGSPGLNMLKVVNTSDGTTMGSRVQLQNSSGDAFLLELDAASYITAAPFVARTGLLYMDGPGGLSIAAVHASGVIRFYTGGATLRVQINTNGTQTWAPYGAGTATFDASGNITSVSDERYKDRITPLPYGLAEVLKLRPVQHGYNALSGLERKHLYGGFLALDVQVVMPLAVGINPQGYLTLADRPILGAVVNAIQELDTRLKALEAVQ